MQNPANISACLSSTRFSERRRSYRAPRGSSTVSLTLCSSYSVWRGSVSVRSIPASWAFQSTHYRGLGLRWRIRQRQYLGRVSGLKLPLRPSLSIFLNNLNISILNPTWVFFQTSWISLLTILFLQNYRYLLCSHCHFPFFWKSWSNLFLDFSET